MPTLATYLGTLLNSGICLHTFSTRLHTIHANLLFPGEDQIGRPIQSSNRESQKFIHGSDWIRTIRRHHHHNSIPLGAYSCCMDIRRQEKTTSTAKCNEHDHAGIFGRERCGGSTTVNQDEIAHTGRNTPSPWTRPNYPACSIYRTFNSGRSAPVHLGGRHGSCEYGWSWHHIQPVILKR